MSIYKYNAIMGVDWDMRLIDKVWMILVCDPPSSTVASETWSFALTAVITPLLAPPQQTVT